MYEGNKANIPMFRLVDNEYAYATVPKEELEEMPWLLLDKEEKCDSIFGSIEDESLILLKYRFR